jgi:hypothetical protein
MGQAIKQDIHKLHLCVGARYNQASRSTKPPVFSNDFSAVLELRVKNDPQDLLARKAWQSRYCGPKILVVAIKLQMFQMAK